MLNNNDLSDIDPDRNLLSNISSSCNYYTLGEYDSILSNERDKPTFRLINLNIRSFHNKSDSFTVFLSNFSKSPNAIVLTETWNTKNNLKFCTLEGFSSFHTFRDSTYPGGGVSIFCKNGVSGEKVEEFCFCFDFLETCVVRLKFYSSAYIIIGIYRPPNGCKDAFLSKVSEILHSPLIRNASKILLVGDMNLDLCSNNDQNVSSFTDILHSYLFLPAITVPTRLSVNENTNSTNLDHIWIDRLTNFVSGVIYLDLSDHCPTFIHFCTDTSGNNCDKIKIETRPFSQARLDSLTNDLMQYDWNNLIYEQCDLNSATESFLKILDQFYCHNFPLKIKYVSNKKVSKPWITPEVKRLADEKSKMYKYYRLGFISKQSNNSFRNEINRKVKEARVNYYDRMFNAYMSDAKRYWKLVGEVLGSKRSKSEVNSLSVNGETFTEISDVSERFNEFFTQIAKDLDDQTPSSVRSPLEFMPPPLSSSLFLSPLYSEECLKIISSLNCTSVPKNRMPVRIFKSVACALLDPICKLVNFSFCGGVFPDCLKLTRITPIFKYGDKSNPSNYRPIAGLHYFSKIFEKALNTRIISFFNHHSLFTSDQFGFRKGMNTGDCILKLVEKMYSSLNDKKYLLSTFIDFRKAFDTVSHRILLDKLKIYGVRGQALDLLSSFITGRKQYVELNGVSSSCRLNEYGVAQGSTLGPTLFIIYVNDLPRVSRLFQTLLFADDTTLTLSHSDHRILEENVNQELDKILNWTNSNRLCINSEKSNCILINNRPTFTPCVRIGTAEITQCNSYKYLGVVLDDGLKFRDHVRNVADKISKNCGILYRIKDYLPMKTRIQFYYNHVYPYLTYNVLVWGGTYHTHLEPIIVQQKRVIRIINNLSVTGHTNEYFKTLGILKFLDLYKFQALLYMYKFKDSPQFVRAHNLNTRNSSFLVPSFNRLDLCQHSITFTGPTFWNELPQYLKELDTISKFKWAVMQHILDQY